MVKGISAKYQKLFDSFNTSLKNEILALPVNQRDKAIEYVITRVKKEQQARANKEAARKKDALNLATKSTKLAPQGVQPKKVVKKPVSKKSAQSDKQAIDSIILLTFLLSLVWSLMAIVNHAFRANIQLATIVLVFTGAYLFLKEYVH